MEKFLEKYPHASRINVAWGEMDALQHVNNVVYFRYFETARIDYFDRIYPLGAMYAKGVGPVISENQARYKRPVTFPDTLLVGVSISDVRDDRFTLHYEVFSERQQALTTTGSSVAVMFDFSSGAKAQLPAELRQLLEQDLR
ncbi:acyl-CoA thioesterase [Shewanella sedimentimangrovi]|uniref:Acyl-CoA thioesterase n=1 Tax=Shewanella sedimentimangrovi TaxID=2814293 RepID=A0ABX7R867_9GAMM|nr:thioesterase family protein [Shewanella sedimentimangrovi]QSX38948.1 acyl-CoA thioesterase [Shewanella sedimentimangrovi]